MTTYRIVWLSICVALGAVGAAVALLRSPEAAAVLLAAFGVVGSLLTMCFAPNFRERATGGRLMLLTGGALLAGTSVIAFVGYGSLLGASVLLLVAAVLAARHTP